VGCERQVLVSGCESRYIDPVPFPPPVRGVRAAVVFLTRVPVGGFPYSREDWRWSSAHFPFAGLLVGLGSAAVWRASYAAGPWAASALAVAAAMMLTGAFHEDGLADTADALGGAYDRAKLFTILKDSRIGSFGSAALTIVLILRVALLARLGTLAGVALVVTSCMARVPPIWLMRAMPYVTMDDQAKSRAVARAGWGQTLVATSWGALAAAVGVEVLSLPLRATLGGVAGCALVALVCGYRFHVRAGGLTGDFLGATEQLCECALLLALACAAP